MVRQFARAEGVETAPMKDEMVLFNAANNVFCVLNGTAAFLWSRLEQPQSLDSLCDAVISSFANAPADSVTADVGKALDELQRTACVVAIDA